MQLTRAADYAVRVMIHLAGMPEGARVNRTVLAELAEVPAEFLGKVLQSLTRSQLILSRRGVTGGFELGRAAERITMLDVVESLEGPLQMNICLAPEKGCGRSAWCAAHEKWAEAQEAMATVLRGATIADLARRSAVKRAYPGALKGEEMIEIAAEVPAEAGELRWN